MIKKQLETNIIKPIHKKDVKHLNPVFVIRKKDGGWRQIVDCRRLNNAIKTICYKQEDHRTVEKIIQEKDYAVTLDLSQAYYLINVSEELSPFLSFVFKGKYYAFHGMPFGYKDAPRTFTKVIRKVLKYMREKWNERTIANLDDIVLLHQDQQELNMIVEKTLSMFNKLRLLVNSEKCHLIPNRGIEENRADERVQEMEEDCPEQQSCFDKEVCLVDRETECNQIRVIRSLPEFVTTVQTPKQSFESEWMARKNARECVDYKLPQEVERKAESEPTKEIESNNTTAVNNLNQRGAGPNLRTLLKKIWNQIQVLKVVVKAQHIPGERNVRADGLSRLAKGGDYEVEKEELEEITNQLQMHITLDAFATKENTKSTRWCRPGSNLSQDGLHIFWRNETVLAHPLISLIPAVIRKAMTEDAKVILLLPD
ncbi:putative Reverse transcriptase (RNA-dependent DNA polymerase) [Monocercomonoides exilis]|uniref:putative Reverse transcriptase (RNA-dependent DNA polymerase) n=1 Tax=Monocercomonoides exilis TaxID=2049356 RepID=UPI00355A4DFC|nr:putative Reverse transcriptase (RNA-dependent DNA polymerase) [Monocercomonoides exilis]|eukprot:MONOS_15997.1-p1 / transcript=MONOS_15997.1 / gene=MONOS_15997 / organism=Monocercomonoides_exilis_PA203 / gene_product=unspecified product / transcript_product=unspecified product / location=Mono_scaffold01451:6022-7578(-) / protein_length=425 / sequence_SO=supercontig / SO=protein_coding / is_pseudo=false